MSVSTVFFFWIDLIGLCELRVSSAEVIGCELSCSGRFPYLAVAVAFVANSQWLESPSFQGIDSEWNLFLVCNVISN